LIRRSVALELSETLGQLSIACREIAVITDHRTQVDGFLSVLVENRIAVFEDDGLVPRDLVDPPVVRVPRRVPTT
jgi:hypothetical protein